MERDETEHSVNEKTKETKMDAESNTDLCCSELVMQVVDDAIDDAAEKEVEKCKSFAGRKEFMDKIIFYVDRIDKSEPDAKTDLKNYINSQICNTSEEEDVIITNIEDEKLKIEKLQEQNLILRNEVKELKNDLFSLEVTPSERLPKTKEEIGKLLGDLKAMDAILKQKCAHAEKSDAAKATLNIRLGLEQERRVRAQNVIGDIEKERITLKHILEDKNSEYERMSQEVHEIKLSCEYKLTKMMAEVKKAELKLEKVMKEKEQKNIDLREENRELIKKSESLEQRYENQLDLSKTLQNELQVSYGESQSLIKEMETLNYMFAELENHIICQEEQSAKEAYQACSSSKEKVTNEPDIMAAAKSTEQYKALLQASCYNEVTTKNGTKMVLSVSKTFLKLKDLILEKKSLEDNVTKLRIVNDHLCSQMNIHEEKLCGITDELNNTWFYVSKIKEQHKKLHSSEQILRAELAEKRQLLKKIRVELTESRTAWDVVKQKTAESEVQWLQLKADFAERKRALMSSSESGVSELDMDSKTSDIDSDSLGEMNIEDPSPSIPQEHEEEIEEDDDYSDSMSIPDPFSDDEDEELKKDTPLNCIVRTTVPKLNEDEDEEIGDEDESLTEPFDEPMRPNEGYTPIFVPSISWMAEVPAYMQPNLLDGKGAQEYQDDMPREGQAIEAVDDNVRDLINRLSTSTARGAFLANRLADIHKKIATGTPLIERNEWFDDQEITETDVDPKETEYDDDLTVPSPELDSEIEDNVENEDALATSTPISEHDSMDDSRPSSTDSMILAIDEAINILDPVQPQSFMMPTNSHEPTHTLFNSPATTAMGQPSPPNLLADEEESDEDPIAIIADEVPAEVKNDGSTAVTRFLIKHLPKQLTQLRNEKHEMSDKISDLEHVVSEQRTQMAEYERRVELERTKLKKMEENYKKIKMYHDEDQEDIPSSFKVPVKVDHEEMMLGWTIISKQERPYSFWINYIPEGAKDDDAVILPSTVKEVEPMEVGIRTSLQVVCGFKGTYTLHIQGCADRMPEVLITLTPLLPEKKEK